MIDLMEKIINREPEKTSSISPDTVMIESIIMKCCKKRMDERYQAISELQKDLFRYGHV